MAHDNPLSARQFWLFVPAACVHPSRLCNLRQLILQLQMRMLRSCPASNVREAKYITRLHAYSSQSASSQTVASSRLAPTMAYRDTAGN